jgi:hypothetical protein
MALVKTLRSVVIVLLACLLATLRASAQAGARTPLTLQEAVAGGLVEYQLTGTGSSSGDAVLLKIRKTAKAGGGTIAVMVPAGTVLRSSNSATQSMVVFAVRGVVIGAGRFRPAQVAALSDANWVTLVLSAFCLEFHKANPSSATTFVPEAVDPVHACVARGSAGLSVAARQAAVWIHTDRVTYDQMRSSFTVSPSDWAAGEGLFRRCATPGASRGTGQ